MTTQTFLARISRSNTTRILRNAFLAAAVLVAPACNNQVPLTYRTDPVLLQKDTEFCTRPDIKEPLIKKGWKVVDFDSASLLVSPFVRSIDGIFEFGAKYPLRKGIFVMSYPEGGKLQVIIDSFDYASARASVSCDYPGK
ncbi:MAG: hypothetical protein AABX38_03055 [Candidatus Micrarchaeota archaeon]